MKFTKKTIRILIFAGLILGLAFFLKEIMSILTPFFIAFLLAYLLNPVVDWIEKKGINRSWSIIIVYIIITGLTVGILVYLIPKFLMELNKFADTIPKYAEQVQNNFKQIQKHYTKVDMPESIRTVINDTIMQVENYIIEIVKTITQSFLLFFTKAFDVILIPILTFYLLKDYKKFSSLLLKLIPLTYQDELLELTAKMDKVLKSFFRGHLLVALIVGFLTTFSLFLIKMEFALILGLLAGVLNIIPYFGAVLSIIPTLFLAYLQSKKTAFYALGIMLVIQQIESGIISPKILGDNLGLHPLIIIFVLLAGGHFWGIIGMILAVPFTAILKILLEFLLKKIIEL